MENKKTIKIQDIARKSLERRGGSVPNSNINNQQKNVKTINKQRVHKISNKILEAPKMANHNWFDHNIKYDVLITGGIGDFLVVESHLFLEKYKNINQVILATRGQKEITSLIKLAYPTLNVKNLLPNFPEDRYHFLHWNELKEYLLRTNNEYIHNRVFKVVDFSIHEVFPRIYSGELQTKKSGFLATFETQIANFNLPKFYVSMVTASTRDPKRAAENRHMSDDEINCVSNICKSKNLALVCVYCNCCNPHPDIIHIKNSSIEESIEIIKKSSGYIGVDSCLSVIAGQKFCENNIRIKSLNGHCLNNRRCYYPFCNRSDLFCSNLCDNFNFEI